MDWATAIKRRDGCCENDDYCGYCDCCGCCDDCCGYDDRCGDCCDDVVMSSDSKMMKEESARGRSNQAA